MVRKIGSEPEAMSAIKTILDGFQEKVAQQRILDWIAGSFGLSLKINDEVEGEDESPAGLDEFIKKNTHDKPDKPAKNVHMLAAYHYSQYGVVSFSIKEIQSLAGDYGVTIPERLDMTLKGSKLYKSTGRHMYKPTVKGELYFKNKYEVSKGKKKKQEVEGEK